MSNYIERDTRSKFAKWYDKMDDKIVDIAHDHKFLFVILFPFVLIGDILLLPIRAIDKRISKRK